MKFLVISDLHANWHALEAVLADADKQFDEIICCGDLVGYNPQPARVLEWARNHCSVVIRGNHDKVVAGIEDLEWFNDVAKGAALWTIANLDPEQIEYLAGLPEGPLALEYFHICHGSPRDEDEYVSNAREAAPCFSQFHLPLLFFGHTHLQGGFELRGGWISDLPEVGQRYKERVIEMHPDGTYMVNPGSVGQPRDGDPRAAYAIYDSDARTIALRRVEYPVQKTAREILQAGLPDVLGLRLFRGN